jgi:hypothetical protein
MYVVFDGNICPLDDDALPTFSSILGVYHLNYGGGIN